MPDIRFSDTMRERMTLSFEVFPPKTEKGREKLPRVLDELNDFHPDYISCTYGAGGSNVRENRSVMHLIRERTQACTHFTCIGLTREGVREQLQYYLETGVDHILALRGDFPFGWTGTRGDFAHASDLVGYIRSEFGDRFEIAVAAAPGGHVDCISEDDDISWLRHKQDLGADYIITQLCYDLEHFKVWRDKLDKAGITIPLKNARDPETEAELISIGGKRQVPCLVIDGVAQKIERNSSTHSLNLATARTAICQLGPLKYAVFTVDSAKTGYGMNGQELADFIVKKFPECKIAYNLDGGGTSELWLGQKKVNKAIGMREIPGMIYFASAASGD